MSEETTDYKKKAERDLYGAGAEGISIDRSAALSARAQVAATLHLADMVEKYGKKIAAELDYIRKRMP